MRLNKPMHLNLKHRFLTKVKEGISTSRDQLLNLELFCEQKSLTPKVNNLGDETL